MMKNGLIERVCFLAVFVLPSSDVLFGADVRLTDGKAEQAGMSARRLAELNKALRKWVGEKRLPGGIVLVARDGKVVLRKAAGQADVEANRPMKTDTPMLVASMTKPITATAVMMLAEKGKLSIDDPVSKYLPAFKDQKVKGGGTADITIRQLLCHKSGMDRLDRRATKATAPAAGQTVLTAFVDALAKTPLAFKPGTKFSYSSDGYCVLGRIIEVVGKQTCEQFLRGRIIEPLGMSHSTFRIDAALKARMATPYARTRDGKGICPDRATASWLAGLGGKLSPIYPAGGLVSTIDDMAIFHQMFLNGGVYGRRRFIEARTVALMTKNHTLGAESGWGLGWSKYYKNHAPIGSSPRHYNHAGKLGTYGFVEPAFGLVVLFFQQLDLRGHIAEDSFKLARSAVNVDPGKAPDYGLPLAFHADFADGNVDRWQPTDPKVWRIKDLGDRKVYNQYKPKSSYKPKYRSPYHISWLDNLPLGDFVIEYKLRSTTKTYGHRDMCLFFGGTDPEHFYYVHMGFKSDANSNSIMIVNGKPRVSIIQDKMASKKNDYDATDAITQWRAPGTSWTDEWHRVRLVRRADAGTIEVYFNDFSAPHMYAIDKTFPVGRIGIGSFDDTGYWDEVKIWGNVVGSPKQSAGESVFNGRDLTGWTIHGTEKWYVENGVLICESGPSKKYGYLSLDNSPQDLDLSLKFKLIGGGNSGVFFRSTLTGVTIKGWQAEVATQQTGGVYESAGRGWLHKTSPDGGKAYKKEDWNDYRVRVVGDHVRIWLNGVQTVDFHDAKIAAGKGKIALQIHSGGGVKVYWKDLMLQRLDKP